MILGFAHMSVNVNDLSEVKAAFETKGYSMTASYPDISNHSSKKKFLSDFQPRHHLMLLKGPGLWPLELTFHCPTVSENRQLSWGLQAIIITVPDPLPLQRLFINGLGFIVENNDLVFLSRLPGWSCRVRLQAGKTSPVRLDAAGATCLAFYCNNPVIDEQRLIDEGATDSTGNFDLTVGGRTMTITMLRAPGGPLIELINLKKS